MSKFQKGDIVYRACLVPFEGGERAAVFLSKVAYVSPQRDGTFTYGIYSYDGVPRVRGAVWSLSGVLEGALFADPVEAMQIAVATEEMYAPREVSTNG
jgi:hypothetical protein